jgi:hypothetical protein
MNLFRRLFGKKTPDHDCRTAGQPPGDNSVARTKTPEGQGLVSVDLDSFGPQSREGFQRMAADMSHCPIFDGTIEHAYTKDSVGAADKCPRCGSPTERKVANFVYATDSATRAMWAPAGLFCTACPTVIIDEGIIAAGVKHGFRFRRVVGIDYGGKKRMDVFRTWNGKKPVYVLDENEQFSDLVTHDDLRPASAMSSFRPRDVSKEKRKRKLADKARRRNRRK